MSLISPEPSLTGLPVEILVQILSYLTMKSDIYNISQISARLQNVAKDKRIIGTKLDVKGDPNFNEKALAFFVNPTVGDKLQEVNIEGASWINPWQLVKNLPSLTKISFTVSKRCPKELVNMGEQNRITHLKKLKHIRMKFGGGDSVDAPQFMTTRFLVQLLSHCENLDCLQLFSDSISWLDAGEVDLKLPKLKYFCVDMDSSSWELDLGSLDVMKSFVRKMLRKNKQELEGWFRSSGGLLMRVNWEEFKQIYDDENSEYFEEVDDDDDWPVVL